MFWIKYMALEMSWIYPFKTERSLVYFLGMVFKKFDCLKVSKNLREFIAMDFDGNEANFFNKLSLFC